MWRSTSRSLAVSWSSSGSTTPVRSPWKASSTKPASRGENTASPPSTRRMAAARRVRGEQDPVGPGAENAARGGVHPGGVPDDLQRPPHLGGEPRQEEVV